MYIATIYNAETNKTWSESFTSYYLFRKRIEKLKYSKKLILIKANLGGV